MQTPEPLIEIVEYNKSYVTRDDVAKVFFENYKDQPNLQTFKGLYISFKFKHGNLAPIILLFSTFVLSFVFYLILSQFVVIQNLKTLILLSLGPSLALHWLFGRYAIHKSYTGYVNYGEGMLERFVSIEEQHQKPGGNFWLVLVYDPITKTKSIAGHLGMVAVDKGVLGDKFPIGRKPKVAHLEMMGITAPYRKLGLGKKLVERAIDFAKENNFDYMDLSVMGVNIPAINLYKKFGFKLVGAFEVSKLTGLTVDQMALILNEN